MLKSKNITNSKLWQAVLITAFISLFIAAAGIALINAANANLVDSVIANNIADDGMSAMQTIRNTNWIKYRENPEKCWLTLPQSTICNDDNKIKEGNYSLTKTNDINGWELIYLEENNSPDESSEFVRIVNVHYLSENEIQVNITVNWQNRLGNQEVKFSSFLTNYINK